jgi:hypothetical protein
LLSKLNPFLPLIQAILIALIGFVLTGRLDSALKERQTSLQERQATVQALEKMSDLLTKINDPDLKNDVRERTVLQVAMYGSDAVYPLFVMAVSKSAYPPATAILGLRVLAVQHRKEVCALLLSATRVPKAINEIRKESIKELTEELDCAKQEAAP